MRQAGACLPPVMRHINGVVPCTFSLSGVQVFSIQNIKANINMSTIYISIYIYIEILGSKRLLLYEGTMYV